MAESKPRKGLQKARDWIARRISSSTSVEPVKAKQATANQVVDMEPDTDPLDDGSSPSTGITFKIAPHGAKTVPSKGLQSPQPIDVLGRVWTGSCREMIQSSLKSTGEFLPDSNGFINNVVLAYNYHHNLIIRPDDIWVAILTQFGLYVNANAEALRSSFVAHGGKKALIVEVNETRHTVNYGSMAKTFAGLLEKNIVDPSLRDWIIPQFTTTTHNDKVVCSVMMMATLKAYFSYESCLTCGIPSITLLGTKADYEAIQQRLDRFEEFGVEPAAFALLLRPVLAQFVAAFDATANGETPNPDFWQRICHYDPGGSGTGPMIAGWITAFCVWNTAGKWQGTPLDKLHAPPGAPSNERGFRPLLYEGLYYPIIDTDDAPVGYAEVDLKVNEFGRVYNCLMIAGHVGAVISGKENARDTLQPASEWFMFEKR